MVDYSNIPRDSRRVPLETRVQFKFDRFSGFISEYSANISPGGIFLRTVTPRPPGSMLELEFRLGDGFELIKGRGEVIWARAEDEGPGRPPGMGIRFLELSEGSRELIYRIVDQHILQGGTPFDVTQKPPGPVSAPPRNAGLPSVSDLFELPPAASAPEPPAAEPFPALAPQRARPVNAASTFAPTFGSASLQRPPRRVLPWALLVVGLVLAAGAFLLRDRLREWTGFGGEAAPPARPVAANPKPGSASSAAPEPAPAVPPPAPEAAVPAPSPVLEPDSGPALTRLDQITWERVSGGTDVLLWGNGAISPETYKRSRIEGNPPRELIRLSGVQAAHRQDRVVAGTAELLQIRMGYHPEAGRGELHVVLDLAHPTVAVTGMVQEPHRLRIRLQRR
ncbi:MAG TPA: TIGR02266 family protein [Thermoanaerobaculia bacterium]|jgi:uncharacterized protein (TIGR02266 family)|nr:TIGR02266 family protein [Thermoanaerobaculia bacterium]